MAIGSEIELRATNFSCRLLSKSGNLQREEQTLASFRREDGGKWVSQSKEPAI